MSNAKEKLPETLHREGSCPKCESSLTSGGRSIVDTEVLRNVTCPQCRWSGEEVFTLAFVGHLDDGTGEML